MGFSMFLFRVPISHPYVAVENMHVRIIRSLILIFVPFHSFSMFMNFWNVIANFRMISFVLSPSASIEIFKAIHHFYFFIIYFNPGWFKTYFYIIYICLLYLRLNNKASFPRKKRYLTLGRFTSHLGLHLVLHSIVFTTSP